MTHIDGCSDPLSTPHPWYVLMELSSSRPDAGVRESFDALLETAFTDGIISDAVVAENIGQANALWRLRETLPEAQKHEGGSIKHDVSVPVSRVPEFITQGIAAIATHFPGARPVPFGHVGDGNIHFNITQPAGADKQAFLGQWAAMNRVVHDIVVGMEGSISAEHGIGQLKRGEMAHYKDPVELDLMRRLKQAIDPANLMNPGKVVVDPRSFPRPHARASGESGKKILPSRETFGTARAFKHCAPRVHPLNF